METFKTVISCDYPTYKQNTNGENVLTYERCYLPIDLIKNRSVNASSQIATHPLLNGDTISDHMFRQPTTITLTGAFSLNGRNINNKTYQNLSVEHTDRLACIEEVFEKIKNNALLCTITTIKLEGDRMGDPENPDEYENKNTRFITRHKMALNTISWTEGLNSLEFTFSFKEVISVKVEEYDVDITDVDLPYIEEPKASSIGTVLYDSGNLSQTIVQILNENGYIDKDWLREAAIVASGIGGALTGIVIVAAAIGLITLSVMATSALVAAGVSVGMIFPVGTIIAIAAVAIAAIAIGIKKFIESVKRQKKKNKIFRLVNGKPDEYMDRLVLLLNKIGKAVNKATNNLLIYNFEFGSDEESKSVNNQYCFVVGGTYYYVTIISINKSPWFEAQIFTSSNGGEPINPKQLKNPWCMVTNLEECDSEHIWFTDETGEYRVYLVNVNMSDEVNMTKEEKLNVARSLSSYTVWVVKGSMKDQLKVINDTIVEQLDLEGYKG